jgi:hypothetical protein
LVNERSPLLLFFSSCFRNARITLVMRLQF